MARKCAKRLQGGPGAVSFLRDEPVALFAHFFSSVLFMESQVCASYSGESKRLGWSHLVATVPPARCDAGGQSLSGCRVEGGAWPSTSDCGFSLRSVE